MKRWSCLLLALVLAAGLFAGCENKNETAVSVQSVAMITGYGALGLTNRYAGIVEAGKTVSVQKAENMAIGEIYVSVGDDVRPGQLLFSYDTDAAKLELEKAKLEKDQMENAMKTKSEQIDRLEKEKAKASADAQIDYTLQIQELQLDVSEAKLNLEAKQKEIERLERLTEDTEVRAEQAGRVQSISDENAENYDPTKPFLTLVETENFRVKGTVSEQYAASLTPGTRMIVRSRMDESVIWSGKIDAVDLDNPVQGSNNPYMDFGAAEEMSSSSKYPFYVTLDSDAGLMLGQHVYIEPEVGQNEQGLYLPALYLVDVDTQCYVWAANGKDRLEKRSVQLGRYDESADSWEILSGLGPNDYIAFPDETCVQGAPVVRYDEASFDDGSFTGDYGEDFGGDFGEDDPADFEGEFHALEEDAEEDSFNEGFDAQEEAGGVG